MSTAELEFERGRLAAMSDLAKGRGYAEQGEDVANVDWYRGYASVRPEQIPAGSVR